MAKNWIEEIADLERDIESGMAYAGDIQGITEKVALPFNHVPSLIEMTAAAQEAAEVYERLAVALEERTLRLDPDAFEITP